MGFWVGGPISFYNSFFAKNYLNFNFFYVLSSALFKNEKKSRNRCKSPKNCLTQVEPEEKYWKKRTKNDKWENPKQKQYFFTFTFLYRKV